MALLQNLLDCLADAISSRRNRDTIPKVHPSEQDIYVIISQHVHYPGAPLMPGHNPRYIGVSRDFRNLGQCGPNYDPRYRIAVSFADTPENFAYQLAETVLHHGEQVGIRFEMPPYMAEFCAEIPKSNKGTITSITHYYPVSTNDKLRIMARFTEHLDYLQQAQLEKSQLGTLDSDVCVMLPSVERGEQSPEAYKRKIAVPPKHSTTNSEIETRSGKPQ